MHQYFPLVDVNLVAIFFFCIKEFANIFVAFLNLRLFTAFSFSFFFFSPVSFYMHFKSQNCFYLMLAGVFARKDIIF